MKNIIGIFVLVTILLFINSCGSYQVADIDKLTAGMTADQVNHIMGKPLRKLSADYSKGDLRETYEYRTYKDELYSIEFTNGRLSRYDFIYDDSPVLTPVVPPYPSVRPDPIRPSYPSRPHFPSRPDRPSQPSRPDTDRPITRPQGEVKPSRPEIAVPEKNPRSVSSSDNQE